MLGGIVSNGVAMIELKSFEARLLEDFGLDTAVQKLR